MRVDERAQAHRKVEKNTCGPRQVMQDDVDKEVAVCGFVGVADGFLIFCCLRADIARGVWKSKMQ